MTAIVRRSGSALFVGGMSILLSEADGANRRGVTPGVTM